MPRSTGGDVAVGCDLKATQLLLTELLPQYHRSCTSFMLLAGTSPTLKEIVNLFPIKRQPKHRETRYPGGIFPKKSSFCQ